MPIQTRNSTKMAALKTQPTVVLYRGLPGTGQYVWSPFVTKLEARLRFAGLSYKTEAGSLGKAPRGKIPYVSITRDGAEAQLVADSQVISDQLSEEGQVPELNGKLSPVEKAQDLALRALLEDKLYFYQVGQHRTPSPVHRDRALSAERKQTFERWNDNYYTMRNQVLQALPGPVQVVVGVLAWRKINTTLWGQGTGRFTREEIAAFRRDIWSNVEALLAHAKRSSKASQGDAFWALGGSTPTEADTTLYGFIASGLVCAAYVLGFLLAPSWLEWC
jgi:hypothetical protein